MFDVVVFEIDVPGYSFKGRQFQTKSLECCLEQYAVTAEGRLCLTGMHLMDEDPGVELREGGPVDLDYHGDLRIVPVEGEYQQYIARFTHGTLEWVRPLAPKALDPGGTA